MKVVDMRTAKSIFCLKSGFLKMVKSSHKMGKKGIKNPDFSQKGAKNAKIRLYKNG